VARDSTAIPETIGLGQIVLGEDVAPYARALYSLHHDIAYRKQIIGAGRQNYERRFAPAVIEQLLFTTALREVLPTVSGSVVVGGSDDDEADTSRV
jgi:hypothetical protein